jgi:hypothetical protein
MLSMLRNLGMPPQDGCADGHKRTDFVTNLGRACERRLMDAAAERDSEQDLALGVLHEHGKTRIFVTAGLGKLADDPIRIEAGHGRIRQFGAIAIRAAIFVVIDDVPAAPDKKVVSLHEGPRSNLTGHAFGAIILYVETSRVGSRD